jgi:hypothetical protein
VNLPPPDDLPRIHALIKRAIAATDPDEFDKIMKELRARLSEHIQRVRALAAERLNSQRKNESLREI